MSETLSYPAELDDSVGSGVTVTFPDFPEIEAWGADEAEALRKGAEMLQAAIWNAVVAGRALPPPSEAHERPVVSVTI